MRAYQLKARIDAGLQLSGREDGEYQFMGTRSQWQLADTIEKAYEYDH